MKIASGGIPLLRPNLATVPQINTAQRGLPVRIAKNEEACTSLACSLLDGQRGHCRILPQFPPLKRSYNRRIKMQAGKAHGSIRARCNYQMVTQRRHGADVAVALRDVNHFSLLASHRTIHATDGAGTTPRA